MDTLDWVLLIIIIVIAGPALFKGSKPTRNPMPRDGRDPVWNRDELDEEGGD
jgi:hypothetical protein